MSVSKTPARTPTPTRSPTSTSVFDKSIVDENPSARLDQVKSNKNNLEDEEKEAVM